MIVTGATGLVGPDLLPLLRGRGCGVQAISRRAPDGASPGLTWTALDLAAGPPSAALSPAGALIHAAPIWLLPPWLPCFAELGVRRVVAFSSTSRQTKADSPVARERELARRLADAEAALASLARAHGMRWTLLRPSLIYGGGRDRNVSDVARLIRRFGFFPIAGEGRGGRQPVHAADLAAAAVAVLDNPATFDRAYDVPGGETLTYAEMVRRIARGLGRRPRLLRIPRPLLRGALAMASRLPRWRHLTPAMADRMDEDLVFDAAPARRDFGYDPRPFVFPDRPEGRRE